jgi:hypothetical protein
MVGRGSRINPSCQRSADIWNIVFASLGQKACRAGVEARDKVCRPITDPPYHFEDEDDDEYEDDWARLLDPVFQLLAPDEHKASHPGILPT